MWKHIPTRYLLETMQLIINNNHKKNTVLFIHGFRKNYTDWNVTEKGKTISIEERVRKHHNTILVHIAEEDYKQPIASIGDTIYNEISVVTSTSIVIIAPSYGCLYALYLAEIYHIDKLFLIEPVIKSESYLRKLQDNAVGKDPNSIEVYKVNNYDSLPTGEHIHSRVIVRIHINIDGEIPNIKELNALTNKNTKSRLIVHHGVSHMIHYTKTDTIYDSITELLSR